MANGRGASEWSSTQELCHFSILTATFLPDTFLPSRFEPCRDCSFSHGLLGRGAAPHRDHSGQRIFLSRYATPDEVEISPTKRLLSGSARCPPDASVGRDAAVQRLEAELQQTTRPSRSSPRPANRCGKRQFPICWSGDATAPRRRRDIAFTGPVGPLRATPPARRPGRARGTDPAKSLGGSGDIDQAPSHPDGRQLPSHRFVEADPHHAVPLARRGQHHNGLQLISLNAPGPSLHYPRVRLRPRGSSGRYKNG
jgi:hypothetical protein